MEPPPIEPDEPLGAENEAQWDRLRSQLDLAEGFWLGFVFSPSARSASVLRERVERVLRREENTLLLIQPASPQELRSVLQRLVDDEGPARTGCVWVEAVRSDSAGAKEQPWTEAWDELFLRMNVRRDVLRKRLPGGLVFVAPPEIKVRVREAAPDLWAVRSLVIDLKAVRPPVEVATLALPLLEKSTGPEPDPEFALREATRRGALGATRSQAQALVQAAEGLLAQGKVREARDAALDAWGLLQGEGGTEEALALATLAIADDRDEDYAAAMDHIQRAIAISQRADPEHTPVHWYHVAGRVALELHDFAVTVRMFVEAETIARLRVVKGENLTSMLDLAATLSSLSNLRRLDGDLNAALTLSEEATMLARKALALRNVDGEARRLLHNVLRTLAATRRALGDEAAALAAEEEAATLAEPPA